MLNLKNVFFILFLASLFAACKNEGASGKTRNGFAYSFDSKGSGKAVQPNDVVFLEVTLFGDTTLLQKSDDPDNLPAMLLPKDWKTIQPINPFFDILSQAKEGDKFTLTMPTDSLPANPMLQGKKNLIYKVNVKTVLDSVGYTKYMETKEADRMKKVAAQTAKVPELTELLKKTIAGFKSKTLKTETTASGLQYFIHEKGNGPITKQNEQAAVDYYGVTQDMKEFDNSFKRGEPYRFPVGASAVIPGWDEALSILPKGTKATIFVPSKLAYGETGSGEIAPNTDLVFYIEIKEK
jgi:FKBP-type peptidyl-prolyl cis-trans isomerase FkpA